MFNNVYSIFVIYAYRQDDNGKRHFVAMLQFAILQFPIFLTELLIVVNIESNGRHSWTAIFTPMYILSFLSIAACILSCCVKRFSVEVKINIMNSYYCYLILGSLCVSLQLEVLAMVNILQLLFLGVRLDGFVCWSWGVSEEMSILAI